MVYIPSVMNKRASIKRDIPIIFLKKVCLCCFDFWRCVFFSLSENINNSVVIIKIIATNT